MMHRTHLFRRRFVFERKEDHTMERRSFTKLLALGAGTWPVADIVSDETVAAAEEDQPQTTQDLPDTIASVQDLIPLAKAKLPRAVFEYIASGSEDEVTLEDNVAAFRRIRVLPPVLHGVSKVDLSTCVLGQKIEMPILLAPVAALRLYHPDGAPGAARAATAAGTVCAVSTSAGSSVEEIAVQAKGPKWFQLYVPKDRGLARALVQRAEKSGFQALIVTVDLGERKDADRRNRFGLSKAMLLKHLRDVGHTKLPDSISPEELTRYNENAWNLSLTWDFFDWLRGITKLPLLVKGVLSADDAQRAVKERIEGIIVSNHGGRRLDGMPASIDRLERVADVVGGRSEVLLDSGVRRGGDVMKALALGARAVLVGRAYAWGLSVGGEQGVRLTLNLLREELENAMITCGCPDVKKIDRRLLLRQPAV